MVDSAPQYHETYKDNPGILESIKRAETLAPHEMYWRDKQSLLASHGYTLRPRFRKGWRPSWVRKSTDDPYECEDFLMLPDERWPRIDARRAVDGRLVHIRTIPTDSSRMELIRDLSSDPLVHDSRNHCLPLLDSFQDDKERNITYIVTPHTRRVDDPRFELVHDILDFAEQILDGLAFLHERGVLMGYSYQGVEMDAHPLYSRGYHPVDTALLPLSLWQYPRYTRTSAPQSVCYYFTDIVRANDLILDKPEAIQTHDPLPAMLHNPFALNVDTIGCILKNALRRYRRLEFLEPLVARMTDDGPHPHITAQEALLEVRRLRRSLPLGGQWRRLLRKYSEPEGALYTAVADGCTAVVLAYVLSKKWVRRMKQHNVFPRHGAS